MKITIDGKVHTNGALLRFLRETLDVRSDADVRPVLTPEAGHAAEVVCFHDEHYDSDRLGDVEIVDHNVFHPSEELPRGHVLLSCGPVAIQCRAADLRRAMLAFQESG